MQSLRGGVPKNWKERKIKEVATTHSGGTPLRSNDRYYNGRIPWVKSSELKQKYLFDTEEYITELALKSTSARMVKADSILFAMYGATAGDMAILKRDSSLNQAVLAISINKDEDIDLEYLYYSLKRLAHKLIFMSQGGGQPNLSKGIIDNLFFSYPSKSEQTAIASILSKVDEAIQATQNTIKSAEKLKKALMQNLLTGKLKPDGTWRAEDEFCMDEKFGKVPIGWNIKSVKDCFDFYPTASYSRAKLVDEGEVMYIHYGDIHTKFDRILDVDKEQLPYIPNEFEKKYEKIKEGDLIVSDASEDWEGVGKCIELVNVGENKIVAGLHTLHLRPKSDDFILGIKGYVFNLHKVSVNIKRLATGIKVYGISKPNLSKVLLPIPSEPEQIFIKEKLDSISEEIYSKDRKIKTLQRLKKSLMQNLLTGKVRVDVAKVNKIILQTQVQEA